MLKQVLIELNFLIFVLIFLTTLENILVDKSIHMKVMDFGLSKIVESISQTQTSRIGTR